MKPQEFFDFITHGVTKGQKRIQRIIRSLIIKADPELAKLLDEEDSRCFLEPMLCAYFRENSPAIPLQQILFAYINEDCKPRRIQVVSDKQGIVYMPNFGCFFTPYPNTLMEFYWKQPTGASELYNQGQAVPFKFGSISRLNDTTVEIYQALPQLLEPLFIDQDGCLIKPEINNIVAAKKKSLENACQILKQQYSQYYNNILSTTQGVLIYKAAYPYSFATMGAHGIAFLNSCSDSSPVFFLEDMLHQCGHIIFNAVTLDKTRFFNVNPDIPLNSYTKLDHYHGTLYDGFHGLFTQTNINQCFDIYRESGIFSGSDNHEMGGRFSDNMKRFGSAIQILGQREFYTEQGWQLYNYFRDVFVSLYGSQQDLIEQYDTTNQPYIFNYNTFLEKNPLPRVVAQ